MKETKQNNLITRPPIVVVMGHIDHGKTTLLDFVRKTKVTESEAGGITQHVGAYEVRTKDKTGKEKIITFLDTPGHEAFSKIRSRGAKTADIAILVVAADDGVKQQTVEALSAIKTAGIPFIVAINKTDKEGANSERVKKELSEKEVYVEDWGGKVPCVEISAKQGKGIDELLEIVLLSADMEELKTNPEEPASGVVLESHVDGKRGITATLLIQNGTLKRGMHIAAGAVYAPVRIFEDFTGKQINEAAASSPVKITGFNKLPESGMEFKTYSSKKETEKITGNYGKLLKQQTAKPSDNFVYDTNKLEMPLIVKTDVAGSKEAIEKEIEKLSTPENTGEKMTVRILRSDAGDISEDDIKLASSGKNTIILGFNVKCPDSIKLMAERFGITIQIFRIIYEMEEWLLKEIEKRRPLETKEEIIAKLKVLKIFTDEKNKKIVGAEVLSGKAATDKEVKILRRDFLLGSGHITEMRKYKAKITEANPGEQVGLLMQTKIDIAQGDSIEIIERTTQ